MDAVMDLTARAVSFITLIQETILRAAPLATKANAQGLVSECKLNFEEYFRKSLSAIEVDEIMNSRSFEGEEKFKSAKAVNDLPASFEIKSFNTKVMDLVWVVERQASSKEKKLIREYAVQICTLLVEWLKQEELDHLLIDEGGMLASPQIWRNRISKIIYADTAKRVALAKLLEYIPIHIVLALHGGSDDVGGQRILQCWNMGEHSTSIPFDSSELKFQNTRRKQAYEKFVPADANPIDARVKSFISERIIFFLKDYKALTEQLLLAEIPLPFEYIFNLELDEIEKNRTQRAFEEELLASANEKKQRTADTNETVTKENGNKEDDTTTCDPFERNAQRGLTALAFSGGGIRSATFNLGLLQGLAKRGILQKIDYLSTVSGGGYIGSWLCTWIKREGSVTKISDRLDPSKSADPYGDDVRPIRWLRMFSNYYNPHRSVMSVDAWTIGVTWLRNTLLNQIVIFLVLLSSLLCAQAAKELWLREIKLSKNYVFVFSISCVLLISVALLTGFGMQWFDRKKTSRQSYLLHQHKSWLTAAITVMITLGAFMISAFFYSAPLAGFREKFWILLPAGLVILGILLLVAILGRYEKCLDFENKPVFALFMIISTAVVAAALSWLGLAGAWELFDKIKAIKFPNDSFPDFSKNLAFTAGLPIILSVFSMTVVTRMALLGKDFPDERREWWGRMGAVIHRIALFWLVICTATFLLLKFIGLFTKDLDVPGILLSWLALVGSALKAAFSGKTSGKENTSSVKATILSLLSEAGPYIFILGLLVIVPMGVAPLMKLNIDWLQNIQPDLRALILALIAFGVSAYLSWRLGVNEFSMHNFSRNRLVRAYLGATRRKTTRDRTSNPFTNLDGMDDEKLCLFTNDQGYCGPYPVINTTMNATQVLELDRQDRKAESFIFTPLFCGFDFSKGRASINNLKKSYDYAFRPTKQYAYGDDNGPSIGTAMAISGAAANPNQGYHSSPGTAFLMTLFNVQMGWWIGNPRKLKWRKSDPDFGLAYILSNLTGSSNTKKEYVSLSDGGHFDNMGLYEMIRRECSFIILGDGEQDGEFTCEGLANAIRRCRIDFGTEITLNLDSIVNRKDGYSQKHFVVGHIKYHRRCKEGILIYIKSSITNDEPVDVKEYAHNNKHFPHQTTADQFFDEQQFESYRKLGLHIADELWKDDVVLEAAKGPFNMGVKTDSNGVSPDQKNPLGLFKVIKEFFNR